ncbi:Ppx/GppA phosphatase family protein [Noviherbaspirillum aridicola]|uniref:Exopolyphosphatase n=1 Tax=Noviherbaspirillum aridicola TaxID=2849687 RepID=A0ABQ4QBF0_9BURK|nr:Ppx/GppA phosphatase family protein [Noviherbaspirillum aridicola]GIZ54004.1 exopolyphosphatase [Noviherbaspirillum aridicola]
MFAAVDLGSNSFRLHVGAFDGEAIRIVRTARDQIRLGAGLDAGGNLTPQAMQSALQCLRDFRAVLGEYELDAVRVVATNTLRVARNAAEFVPQAEQAIGYPIEIISGEEEGRLIYMGVSSVLPAAEQRLVVDIGGGSTEVIVGRGSDILQVESFSIGTAGHSLSFFPGGRIDDTSFEAAVLAARSTFEDAAPLYKAQSWSNAYGSSGTIRTTAEVIARNAIGDGRMSQDSLRALAGRLIAFGDIGRVNLAGIRPDRAIAVAGGLAILLGLMQELDIPVLHPVDAGLRMGVLWDLQLRATQRDRREQSVRECMRRFRVDADRANRVANAALTLYARLKPAGEDMEKYLRWSALLHEIGLAVSHTGFHKHSAYIIDNADLPGFTTREQRLMSTLALAQKGNLRKVADALEDGDRARAILALRLATMFMHSRIDGDISDMRLRMKKGIELELKRAWLQRHPTVGVWIDKERAAWDEAGYGFQLRTAD